ncbi:MAG: hypothetical protein NTX49_05215 [Chlamydiae bacterium]|nr:hypothetical protein [Chlamydiota bacterium]
MFVIRHYEHPSPVFRELEPTQLTLNKRSHCVFTLRKDNEAIRVFHHMEPLTNLVFHCIEQSFTAHQRSSPRGSYHSFEIDSIGLIQELKRRFLKQVPAPGSAGALTAGSWGEEEVALEKASIRKVCRIFSSYFERKPQVFSLRDDLPTYFSKTIVDLYDAAYQALNCEKIEIPPSFSEETLRDFEVPKGRALIHPHKMTCYSFAYLQIKEKRAENIIFQELETDAPLDHIITQLREWKYQAVDWPIAGDLVVYIGKDKAANHVGVYQASGKVLSKLGITQPTAHEHDLFNVPTKHYGRQVIFFRKPTAA